MGDGFIGAFPDFERPSLSLSLSHNRQDLSEGTALTSGLSPPSSPRPLTESLDALLESPLFASDQVPLHNRPRPLYDVHDLLLTTEPLDSLLELPLFASDQHTSSCPSRSPLLDQSCRLGYPALPQASLHNPRANLIPKSSAITGLTSEPRNSEASQVSMAVIQESTMDRSPATVQMCQALRGVDGSAEFSMSGHGASSPHSPHQNEGSTNLQSSVHHVAVTSSIASRQVTSAGEIPGMFWCHDCGISFVQRQGFNRHNKDKHMPRNICPLCGIFGWPSARRYLFTKHLKRHHPEAKLRVADGSRLDDGRASDLRRYSPIFLRPHPQNLFSLRP